MSLSIVLKPRIFQLEGIYCIMLYLKKNCSGKLKFLIIFQFAGHFFLIHPYRRLFCTVFRSFDIIKSPWYDWENAESGIKHQKSNHQIDIIKQLLPSYEVNIKLSTPERLIYLGIKPSGKITTLWLTTFDVHLIWKQ